MAQYSKRTCKGCGIKLPQPNMICFIHTPVSVNGSPLASREAWHCFNCHYPKNGYESNRTQGIEKKLDEESLKDKAGKARWAAEVERRRKDKLG